MKFRAAVLALFVVCIILFIPVFTPALPCAVIQVTSCDEDVFRSDDAVYVPASAAVLMDADSGRVLFAKNEKKRLPMASTTKIMTCLIASECLDPDDVVTVPKEAVGVEGSSIYLEEGEKLTVRELLYGLMLRSGNDAASAVAIAVSGSVDGFVDLMNLKAKSLGLEDTHFMNPSGLPAEDHYTTARDLARLASYALKNELFASVAGEKRVAVSDGKRYLVNRNKLLFTYDGMIGVKTGYTPEAGKCLVTAAKRNGVTLVAVTLNDGNVWNSHTALLDYGFDNFESVQVPRIEAVYNVYGGVTDFVKVSSQSGVCVTLPKGAELRIDVYENVTLYAPVKQDDVVSYAEMICGNETVGYVPLYAESGVGIKKQDIFERLFK